MLGQLGKRTYFSLAPSLLRALMRGSLANTADGNRYFVVCVKFCSMLVSSQQCVGTVEGDEHLSELQSTVVSER